ncbi:MAG: hypothetical protein H0U75_07155 [Legionella sp.]|nr:hypothetical protein [Legionella sp.]
MTKENTEKFKEYALSYQHHLEKKILKMGTVTPGYQSNVLNIELSQKLQRRYEASISLTTLSQTGTLSSRDVKEANGLLEKILDNRPDWSERPLLQQITDFLTLGLKPLYRGFFSKEKDLQQKLKDSFPKDSEEPPKFGK